MSKINLREIDRRAKQWDHPMKGLIKFSVALKKERNNILKVGKKERELYCISLTALALKNDTNEDWWINIPELDPPDGLVMTLSLERSNTLKGNAREVEVVEHRGQPDLLFETVRNKMTEKSYDPDTILVCLVLSPAVYDFRSLAQKLISINSSLKHIFVVFAGIPLEDAGSVIEKDLRSSFSMVQLVPSFLRTTFNLQSCLSDFEERYNLGQESRLIKDGQIFYGTTNSKFICKV